ncbi:hypothetical protein BCR44DRAFT_1252868 [Catenaria anguillulae PL171]|uniref:Uncharacterized protein n=1 Tax=Catenaria anguillulae PL171 TaxID=765915 RepID=A0A1Y2HCA5_9FUNG|nr:hypothetical protein BCR44DRAFT_1252868 [Catenaria anguillulae PL171]
MIVPRTCLMSSALGNGPSSRLSVTHPSLMPTQTLCQAVLNEEYAVPEDLAMIQNQQIRSLMVHHGDRFVVLQKQVLSLHRSIQAVDRRVDSTIRMLNDIRIIHPTFGRVPVISQHVPTSSFQPQHVPASALQPSQPSTPCRTTRPTSNAPANAFTPIPRAPAANVFKPIPRAPSASAPPSHWFAPLSSSDAPSSSATIASEAANQQARHGSSSTGSAASRSSSLLPPPPRSLTPTPPFPSPLNSTSRALSQSNSGAAAGLPQPSWQAHSYGSPTPSLSRAALSSSFAASSDAASAPALALTTSSKASSAAAPGGKSP